MAQSKGMFLSSKRHSNKGNSNYDQEVDSMNVSTTSPDNHSIHLFDEARNFYKDQTPPFLHVSRSVRDNKRGVELATESGDRRVPPILGKVVAAHWSSKHFFWTLDLNGTKHIVKCFAGAQRGGGGGARYLRWLGPGRDFDKIPAAFTQRAIQPRNISKQAEDEDEDESESESDSTQPFRTRSETPNLDPKDDLSTTDDAISADHAAQAQQYLAKLNGISTPSDSDKTVPPIHRTKAKPKNSREKGKRPTRDSDLPPRVVRGSVRRSTLLQSPNKRRKTDTSIREPSSMANRDHDSYPPAQRQSESQHADARETSSSRGPGGLIQPSASTSNSTNLSPREDKFKRTTLFVRVNPDPDFVPMKLNEYPNAAALHSQVLKVWGITEDSVAKVTITFAWRSPEDRMRTMLLNKHQEDCLLHLFEQVEESECWAEANGKCLLDVEILLK
ncbi:hypothetical protein MMC13_005471 [Lambiella insularis]|nr:hypothetical protein [Lambiella insularis]